MTCVIKRYPNRKLYDTAARQYITLEGVAGLIRGGEEIQVVDHASGEDVTALTLSQIIFEQEKRKGGVLSRDLLAGLIKAGEETLDSLGQRFLTPRDFLRQVDEEIRRRVEGLVGQNILAREEGARWLEKLLGHEVFIGHRAEEVETAIETALAERGVPSRQEIQRLQAQVDLLLGQLDDTMPGGVGDAQD